MTTSECRSRSVHDRFVASKRAGSWYPLQRFYLLRLLIVFFLLAETACAQQVPLNLKESATRLLNATVRIDSGKDRSSGVIVSPSGLILTVAHGLTAQTHSVQVIFHDGTHSAANVVARLPRRDVALLRLSEQKKTQNTFLRIESRQNVDVKETGSVLSAGYPAHEINGLTPIVRLGRIVAVGRKTLRSTCVLTVGDSGGPVVTTAGRLLGIHQKIGLGQDANLHLKIQECLDALKDTPEIAELSVPEKQVANANNARQLSASELVLKNLRYRTVDIIAKDNESAHVPGTLIDDRTVATKLSAIVSNEKDDLTARLGDGTQMACTVLTKSRPLDLLLLQLESPVSKIVQTCLSDNEHHKVSRFDIVFAGDAASAGLLSRSGHNEPPLKPKLGCNLRAVDGKAIYVTRVASDSAAADARLEIDDRIATLNMIPVDAFEDISRALETFQPGDKVTFGVERKGAKIRTFGQLRHDPGQILNRTVFLDGRSGELSVRRSGFESVLVHDAALKSAQMGAPLVDFDGQLVGINIAKRSRESVLAVPMGAVYRLHRSAMSKKQP